MSARRLSLGLLTLPVLLAAVGSLGAAFGATAGDHQAPDLTTQPSRKALADIPARYLALYQSAAAEENLDWTILAAVGKVETDHGRLDPPCATSSAGARGPMQFLPGTWALPNVGKGGNVCAPEDAIPAAARYLRAGGAPDDYRAALLSYNHAEWYVSMVLAIAVDYRGLRANGDGLEELIAEADRMIGLDRPYLWGGGHQAFDPDGPWDCSGAMSWLMNQLGLLEAQSPITSTGFMIEGAPGRGSDFTIWANPDHVFLIVERGAHAGQSWGTATRALGETRPVRGGPQWHVHSTAGFVARHYPGH